METYLKMPIIVGLGYMMNEDSQKTAKTWTLDHAPLERLNELGSEIKVGWPMTKYPHKRSGSNDA